MVEITTIIATIIGLIAILISSKLAYDGGENIKTALDISKTVRLKDQQYTPSFGKVNGFARRHDDVDPIYSTLKNIECIVYSSTIKDSSNYIPTEVFHDENGTDFIIESGGEEYHIDPTNADIILDEGGVHLANNTPAQEILIEEGYNITPEVLQNITATEGIIKDGDSVHVYGQNINPSNNKIYNKGDERLIISNMDERTLKIKLTLKSIIYIVFGIGLSAVSLLIILSRTGLL